MSGAQRDESDERVIHRLEAFSDIVIGFSLAELALSLNAPHGAAGLLADPSPLVAFVLTFGLVCGIWWSHHKLFTHYFVPIGPAIVLNFLTLGSVGFAVYTVQLTVRPGHGSVDFVFYEGALASVYLLLSLQFWIGWVMRRTVLTPALAERGLQSAILLMIVAVVLGVGAATSAIYGLRVAGLQNMMFVVIGLVVALRIFMRLRRRRLDAQTS